MSRKGFLSNLRIRIIYDAALNINLLCAGLATRGRSRNLEGSWPKWGTRIVLTALSYNVLNIKYGQLI